MFEEYRCEFDSLLGYAVMAGIEVVVLLVWCAVV